jgi:hypothetical protein
MRLLGALAYIVVGMWLWVSLLPDAPPALGIAVAFALLFSSAPLFNKGLLRKLKGQTRKQYIAELEAKGLLIRQVFESARAFYFDDLNTGCSAYFVDVGDRGVLCLYGQDYNFEPIDDDKEFNQPRQFPCTQFVVIRKKGDPEILDVILEDKVFEPTVVKRPNYKALSQHNVRLENGELISHVTYDELLRVVQTQVA